MKIALSLTLGLVFAALVVPAHAQMAGGMGGAGTGPGKMQPRLPAPNIAPSGLPGIGGMAPLATSPNMQKPTSGDPTQQLFTAINNNDYRAAQDAVSRGADLRAVNQFNETPLDLSIALNRNDITFLLLGTRNELAAQGDNGSDVMGAPWTLGQTTKPAKNRQSRSSNAIVPVRAEQKVVIPSGATGTPDPQAGFLGFNPKS